MVKITEVAGRPHVFTLKDGKTFRILAHETKKIAEGNISNEIVVAESKGIVLLTKINQKESQKTNKKSGGTK